MTVKGGRTPARGRWCCSTPTSCTSRASSCEAIRRSRATACRGSSSASWPAPNRRPFTARQRPARPGAGDHGARQSAHRRVIVNRVWMHHFGEPLVSTPSDFGTRSTPPTHPELLDYLAARLQREGWSLKALHRSIVLSSTYQQASFDRPDVPPGRPREPLALAVSAATARPGGDARHPACSSRAGSTPRWGAAPWTWPTIPRIARRTVYGLVDRQSLPAVFRAFDFASPDQSAERRPRTTVPQQALFSMNAPFVIEQAKALTLGPRSRPRRRPRPGSPRSIARSWPEPRSGRGPGRLAVPHSR